MWTIHDMKISFDAEADDRATFDQHFRKAIADWWREQKEKEQAEQESRADRSIVPPSRL
jgi:hypothetical protein